MAWSSSDRRSRLPKDWAKRRQECKRRAKGRCQAEPHAPGCNGIGTECDHIIANDDHTPSNLQWLSEPCHKAKTTTDNAKAKANRSALRKRPAERHPGLLRSGSLHRDHPAAGLGDSGRAHRVIHTHARPVGNPVDNRGGGRPQPLGAPRVALASV